MNNSYRNLTENYLNLFNLNLARQTDHLPPNETKYYTLRIYCEMINYTI